MKLVIDTNRIIAAFIKNSTTRDILFDRYFEFITPDYTLTEIQEHKNELKAKTNLSDEEFDVLLSLLFERIEIVPVSEYEEFMDECKNDINDLDDIPILATAIAAKASGIWAHDPHFKKQNKLNIFTNIDLLKLRQRNQ